MSRVMRASAGRPSHGCAAADEVLGDDSGG